MLDLKISSDCVVVVEVKERPPIWSQKSCPHPSLKTPLPMTKLPQAPKMGVGVHEVVEMYATSLCDTEPIVKKVRKSY